MMALEPIIASTARKHGVSDQDMLHAYANPIRIYGVDEDLAMFIGPDRSARMLEVGVVDGDLAPVIVHAMKVRAKFLR
ncbi:MAG: hypothetical protein WCF33_21895 [Pseudonocardiaceae bacterium]